MKRIICLLIVMILLLSACQNNSITDANKSNSTIKELSSNKLVNYEETPNNHKYNVIDEYNIDSILSINGYKKHKFYNLIGYNTDYLYLLIVNEYNYFSVATLDRKANKIAIISESFIYDSISSCIPVKINYGRDAKIYLFAHTINNDKSFTLDVLVLNIDVLNNNSNLYNNIPKSIYQEENCLSPTQTAYIKDPSIGSIAFTINKPSTDGKSYNDFIYYIDIQDDSIKEVANTSYTINNNKYTGEKILCIGGINTLYYQIATLNNESINSSKNFTIYSNSLSSYTVTKTLSYDKPLSIITGREDYIFAVNNEWESSLCFSLIDGSYSHTPIINLNSFCSSIDKNRENGQFIIFNSKNISIYDTVNKTYSALNCIGDNKKDFYIDKDILSGKVSVAEQLTTYRLDRNEFAYVYEKNGQNIAVIYGEDTTSYSKEFDQEMIKNISHELFSPYIEIICSTDKYDFYKETSCKSYRQANRIIWKYDKNSKQSHKLYEYTYYEGNNLELISENKYIIIYGELLPETIKINTFTGEIENNSQDDQQRVDTREPFYLTNIPYDRSIDYTDNPIGNIVNGGRVISDENYIYFINTKDENKLYKIDKYGKNSEKIFDESAYKLQLYKDKIYLLTNVDNDEKNTLCSIYKDGKNLNVELNGKTIYSYLVKDNFIYYVAYADKNYEDSGLRICKLYSLDTSTNESHEIDTINFGFGLQNNDITSINDMLYYVSENGDYIEYNMTTKDKNTLIDTSTNGIFYDSIILKDNELYYESKNDNKGSHWEIYKTNLTNKDTQKIFAKNKDTDMLFSTNVTDNYVFFIYAVLEENYNGKVYVFRMKHDGSELVKLYEVPTRSVSNLPSAFVYIVDDKLFIYNNSVNNDSEKIIILDFDGNRLDWDI